MIFTVDRRFWMRGLGEGMLYDSSFPEHNMCCLGFVCEDLGIGKELLDNEEMPIENSFFESFFKYLPDIKFEDVYTCTNEDCSSTLSCGRCINMIPWVRIIYILADINDDDKLTDAQREMMLNDILFYVYGHTFEFIN